MLCNYSKRNGQVLPRPFPYVDVLDHVFVFNEMPNERDEREHPTGHSDSIYESSLISAPFLEAGYHCEYDTYDGAYTNDEIIWCMFHNTVCRDVCHDGYNRKENPIQEQTQSSLSPCVAFHPVRVITERPDSTVEAEVQKHKLKVP